MPKLLLISYDAVGDKEFGRLMQYPNFARLARQAVVVREVDSVFITNTYPVHTSIITGVAQQKHGITSNTNPFPQENSPWWYQAKRIKAQTLWQAAAHAGLQTAAVMWPVTGGAKEIRWNIPEIMVQPGENQVAVNLTYGSKLAQLGAFLRHRKLLQGIEQPARDKFAAACMADFLRKKPALALMHFTAYDSLCHEYGCTAPQLEQALAALDENLGLLLSCIDEDTDVIVFSDHAQLDAPNQFMPNDILCDMGLLHKDGAGRYAQGDIFIECCGGSAFLHGTPAPPQQEELRRRLEQHPGFNRYLTSQEMAVCGRQNLLFGFAAKIGWQCAKRPIPEIANHGYPLDYDGYKVFYMAKGPSFGAGRQLQGGSLLDITPAAAESLGLPMQGLRPLRQELLR